MKVTNTLITLFIAALSVNAQVILTKNNVPPNGTMYVNYDANSPSNFNFSKTGTANVWDFTGITPIQGEEDTIFYAAPSTVPGGPSFPNADLVTYEKTDKTYSFIKLQNTGAYILGLYGDVTGKGTNFTIPASTPLLAQIFPFSANTKYEGPVLIEYKAKGADVGTPFDSIWVDIRNYVKVEVIATGTIVLPSGSFPALLERKITRSVDSSRIKFGGMWALAEFKITNDSTFKWFTQQTVEPYAKAIYVNGQVDVSYHKSSSVLGLVNEKTSSAVINCYPNPARETLYFNIENEKIENVVIVSASGIQINAKTSSANSVDVGDLQPGIYVAKIQLKNGQTRLSTFVKN